MSLVFQLIFLTIISCAQPIKARPKVICESECFFALSKPCKVHSLPLRYSEKDNLISFLRAEGKSIKPHWK